MKNKLIAVIILAIAFSNCHAQSPEDKLDYERSERCSKIVRQLYDGANNGVTNYVTNHYSKTLQGCFAIERTGNVLSSPKLLYTLFNVLENTEIGQCTDLKEKGVAHCEIDGVKCTTKAQWDKMADRYMKN